MARVKQEVKEQRAQQKRQRDHDSSVVLAAMAPSTGVSPPSAPPKPPRPSTNVFSSGCIDLTLDDDTEDEEEKDEPLGQYVSSAASPRESLVDLAAEEDEEGESEKPQEKVDEIELLSVNEREDDGQDEDQDTDSDTEARPVASRVSQSTPSFQRFSMSDVESDEDDELPVRSLIQDARTVDDEETKCDDEVEILKVTKPPETTGLRSMMKKALSFMLPSYAETRVAEKAEDQEERRGEEEEEEEAEEEEDEALPEVYAPPTLEKDISVESTASDSGSAMEIDDGGDQATPSEADASPQVRVALAGASLEDGEIFEEGAVIKSPTAVKQAIELELQAAKGAKKRPKKRGRKKNKRKAEVLVPVDTVDEFGRVVRQHVESPAQPSGQEPPSSAQPLNNYPIAGSSFSSSPSGSASPSPALLQTPPRPLMMPPPLPRMPPPPPIHFPNLRVPMAPFPDEHIVRVNRHGSVEPFSIHHGGARPPLPQFPPMPLRPPAAVGGGFRYVSVNPFQPPPVPGANRGFKRPLPSSLFEDDDEADAGIDLDSLRAAALRTKRKVPVKETPEAMAGEKTPAAPPNQSPKAEDGEVKEKEKEKEEDPSLDALRAQLLKSIRPRKRPALSSQATPEASKSPPQLTTGESSQSAPGSKPTTPPSLQKTVTASLCVSESATPLPESPMFRPLTAASQSIVIRFSLDDVPSKGRSYSVESESAIAKYGRVVEEVRAKADLQPKMKSLNAVVKKTSPVKKSLLSPTKGRKSKSSSPQKKIQQPPVQVQSTSPEKKTITIDDCEEKMAAPQAAEQLKAFPVEEVSNPVDVHAVAASVAVVKPVEDEVLKDPASLEAEREACLASIREADAQLSRLNAEIAALRHVLVAKEDAAAVSSSSTPAAKMAVEI